MEASLALTPAMTEGEQQLLQAAVAGRRSGLEFGCGGSTAAMLAAGLPRLYSADSDLAWLQRVAADPRCAPALAAGKLHLLHVDIGPVGPWGWPKDSTRFPQWPGYWRDPWEAAGTADVVLVDGRFRVACALNSLIRMEPGGILLVHDFWQRETYRGALLRHFEVTGSAGSLAMLSPRKALNTSLFAADLAAYAFDPR